MKNTGSISVIALLLLTTLSSLILVFAGRSALRIRQVSRYVPERQALYTAEAGIDYACYEIKRVSALKKQKPLKIAGEEDIIKTGQADSLKDTLPLTVLDGGTFEYYPFSDSGLGLAEVTGENREGFLHITSSARYRSYRKTITATLGAALPKAFSAGLIITGGEKLRVQGGTVEGKVLMRQAPQPAGAFMEFELLTGDLPEFNEKFFTDEMQRIFQASQKLDSSQKSLGELVVYNSSRPLEFKNDSILTHAGNVLIQGDRFGKTMIIEGPGLIESGLGIQISGDVQLKNITLVCQGDLACFDQSRLINCTLLSSSRVHLGGKTDFSGTIYSQGTLEIMNEAKVRPYSVMFVKGGGKKQGDKAVFMDEQVTVSGTLLVSDVSGIVYLGYDAIFSGIIYTRGFIDIRGLLNGAAAAKGFKTRLEEGGAVQNVFMDGKIDRAALPYDYCAPAGLLVEPDFEVVEWQVKE
jgi:hypothetical protein